MNPNGTPGSKPHSHPSPRQRFFGILRPERRDIEVLLLFSLMNGVLLIAQPMAVDAVVNNIAFGGEQKVYLQALIIIAIALGMFLGVSALMRGTQAYVMETIERRLFVRMAADLSYRLPHCRISDFERTLGPEMINRFFEVVTLQKLSSTLLLEGVNVALSTVIGLVVLSFYHPYLLAFSLTLILCLILILGPLGHNGVKTSIQKSYAKHAVVDWLEQLARYPTLFKGTGAAEFACRKADALSEDYLHKRERHFSILLRQIIGLLTLQAVASGAMLALGTLLVLRGELTLGQLVASELILTAIVDSIAKLSKQLAAWYDALASSDKLGHLVDLSVEPARQTAPVKREGPAALEGRHIGFAYPDAPPLFHDLSFRFPAGSRVAVVGAAGYGSSTLLDLLFGLRPIDQGELLMDGVDLRHWPLEALREDVALVRGTEIVSGTILENVSLGRANIGPTEVRSALESVGLLPAILNWPSGIDTPLMASGRPLTSTQRVRLVLARAIVGRPRLLILDECLEGLDATSVAQLAPFLFSADNPWTLIMVTRDPDLIRRCNHILRLGDAEAGAATSIPTTST
ncbi:MAG: peptidase domain-containing ABC transporter [Limisphaerales bacterium]